MEAILQKYDKQADKLMDILIEVQSAKGFICKDSVAAIADGLGLSKVDVEQTMSFYHFFTTKPVGKYAIYLNDSVMSNLMGRAEIVAELEKETGAKFGSTTEDGTFGLYNTSCIGMNDQEPAALINGKVFTKLTPGYVKEIIAKMKDGKTVEEIITSYGDGNNKVMKSMVRNNIQRRGEVIFADYDLGSGLRNALAKEPDGVIDEVKVSDIRGRGGAGFPTGMKWEFCARETEPTKYIICNADEGEPGTFKDRVILTENAKRVFEGMAIGAYAIGAQEGILYLRSEYTYMKDFLENSLAEMRKENLLGKNVLGKTGFDFDIRIQFGAGAYVCGEESALIESIEGKRGEPRNRPPFPAQKGYMQKPTVVNNVETFCSITQILKKGGNWYSAIGSTGSTGTKVLSISGDIKNPGVYEIEWGMTVSEMLEMVGAEDTQAVQVAGPSGMCIGPKDFGRRIACSDLPTGGSMMVFDKKRNIIKDVVLNFMNFFADESCGSCTPCRAFNVILRNKIEAILAGNGIKSDIDDLLSWSEIVKTSTRCGLGQTSANPIVTTIRNFKEQYEELLADKDYISTFDIDKAVAASCKHVDRVPNL